MKSLFYLLIFGGPLVAIAHPLKMSLVYMEYDTTDQSLFVECRFFTDDLSLAIEEEMAVRISEFNWSPEDEMVVNQYINQHVQLSIGDHLFKFEPYEVIFERDQKVVFLRYEFRPVLLIAGQQMTISNDALFRQFQYGQTNVLQIEIPRIAETMMQSDMDNYTQTFKIK